MADSSDPEVPAEPAALCAADVAAIAERLALALALDEAPIPAALGASSPEVQLEALRRRLGDHLARLLAADRARLVQLLYQLDVDERRVDALLARTRLDEVAAALAALVVERAVRAQRLALRYGVRDRDDEFR